MSSGTFSASPGDVRALSPGSEKNGADARDVSYYPLECVLRVATLGVGLKSQMIGMPEDKKEQLLPHCIDFRIYSVISFYYFLLSCFLY